MNIIERLKQTCDKLLEDEKLLSLEELNEGYLLFQSKFSPDILKGLDGEPLIETMFNISNHNSLNYWLEFKNDDEFKTNMYTYGNISGGSAFKYIMFKRNKDNKWVTGNPQNPTVLSIDEAIELGRKLRDSLVTGAQLIENLDINASIKEYIKLQENLDNVLIENMSNLGWVHKYYHMIYPNKIDAFHNTKWQKHGLISSHIKPIDDNKLYIMAGQYMDIARKSELPVAYIMNAMVELFGGRPIDYFRIGTTGNNKSYWQDMRKGGYISIGWPKVGDLRQYGEIKKIEMKEKLRTKLEEHYQNDPRAIGRTASQILSFYYDIKLGDIVVAVDGEKLLGIGKIVGSYEYMKDLDFPHCIPTEWLYISDGDMRLPKAREGIRTTVYRYKDLDNILYIEKLKDEGQFLSETKLTALSPLTGTIADVQDVLNRKKQVILYGPPGTGKTYYAEKASKEIAARNMYKKSFIDLSESEKQSILGDGRTSGVVRICCFHPSYGYEDFIEGIKPNIIDGKTQFELKDGIFKSLCLDAKKKPDQNFYLIVDEINRGDISRIFGELIMLIEVNKRNKDIILPLSNEPFSVPENVYIIGTMNTADRSISLLDVALRRRFGFIELMPDYSLLEGISLEGLPLARWLKEINRGILENIGKDARNLQIGHSYFLENERPIRDIHKFKSIVKEDIIPLIEEYCYGDYDLIANILGQGIVDTKAQCIRYELFDSQDNSNFVNVLLQPWPDLKTTTDDEDEEESIDGEDDEY
ncbi:AAA family ATPase [Anaerosalibacter bizertensis]|uniref:AAA family ATPase n=1 Tax=Anaerosalibacter bizertensis TaxID=932217 RepID=UPI0035171518